LLLGFVASFAPNLSASADSTAFFTSRGFAQRNAGAFLSAVMAAPMFAHPVIADELTYSVTALESSSGVMLNPMGVRWVVVLGPRRNKEGKEKFRS
jgi:hypothetical protein